MAQLQIPPPSPMDTSGDVVSNWKFFKACFMDYITATKLAEEAEEIQVATLRSVMGKESRIILQPLTLSDADRAKVQPTLAALEKHFRPQTNFVYERYIFRKSTQKADENFDTYLAQLRKLASSCEATAPLKKK